MRIGLPLTVVLCTRNPRVGYYTRVLAALAEQTLSPAQWDLLIVDNGSDDPVSEVGDLSWKVHHRVAIEDEPGLVAAKARGARESTTPLVVFLDDDTLLAPEYLQRALEIGDRWPRLGVWGGEVRGEFEGTLRTEVEPRLESVGVRLIDNEAWSNARLDLKSAPWGAGSCVRREVLDAWVQGVESDPRRAGLGVKGQGLLRCEDIDLAFTATDLGYGTGIFPELVVTHLIRADRLTDDYLVRVAEGNAYSQVVVAAIHGRSPARTTPVRRLRQRVGDLRVRGLARAIRRAERRGTERAERDLASE